MKKIYLVFRENASYDVIINWLKTKGNLYYFTFRQGEEILETERIRQIEPGSVVLTDQAAIEGCSSLSDGQKRIVRIDSFLQEKFGESYPTFFAKFLAAFNFLGIKPEEIKKMVFLKKSLAAHPEEEFGREIYDKDVDYFQVFASLLKKYFGSEFVLTDDPRMLIGWDKPSGELSVIDRHASHMVTGDVYKKSLKLPLYENSVDECHLDMDKEFGPLIELLSV